LTVNQKTGQCFGHCAGQNQVVGLGIIMILGIILLIVVIVILMSCIICYCCCGCCFFTGYQIHQWVKEQGILLRGNGFHSLPDERNGQQQQQQHQQQAPMIPMTPIYPIPGHQIPAEFDQFGQFVRPRNEQTKV
jgi:hypothetical protein